MGGDMDNRGKSLLVVAVALLSGMVIGGAVTATIIRHNVAIILDRNPLEARNDFMRGLTDRLRLGPGQKEEAEARLGEVLSQAHLLHLETQARSRQLFERFAKDMAPVLDDAQRRELSKLVQELTRHAPPPPLPPRG